MPVVQRLRRVADLTDPAANRIANMSEADARQRVADSDAVGVREIRGPFALVTQHGTTVRMARSLGVPLRYFIAKERDGPALVAAHRIDEIAGWLRSEGLAEQFYPSYTRMAPAHHITEVALVGCPDPNPSYARFVAPPRDRLPADAEEIGRRYAQAVFDEIAAWLAGVPADAAIGVCFSGGVDSGAVLILTYHAMLRAGQSPSRLKAFTLSVDGVGADAEQARQFVREVGLEMLLEVVDVPRAWLDYREAVRVMEDYKPHDVQAAAMVLALARGIRARYADWTHLLDGDGGDENFKDYPIEENPELTIRSVLNNRLLYHEGWGLDRVKHSLTYSGGMSRGCARTFAPLRAMGFAGYSPMTAPAVVETAEGIPFVAMTNWDPARLYAMKGEIVSRGVRAVTGLAMPAYPKRRFQHGGAGCDVFAAAFPADAGSYRRAFQALYDA